MKDSDELYTIGQISKLCNIPIKTLRYYDEIGILLPEVIDEQNKFRYYSKKQMLELNIIKHFKASGFSLDEIRLLLKRKDLGMLVNKLEDKLLETRDKIQELEYLHQKLEKDIDYLKKGKDFSEYFETDFITLNNNLVELKNIPIYTILFTRYHSPSNPGGYIKRYSELAVLLEKYNLYRVGPLMAVFYDDYTKFDYNNADIEVCLPVAGDFSVCPNIREYGGFLGVTIYHKGSYADTPHSYGMALNWIEENGYQFSGAATEKYIIDPTTTKIEENYVTEIILPTLEIEDIFTLHKIDIVWIDEEVDEKLKANSCNL